MGFFVAIDGGGTSTRAGLYDAEHRLLVEATAGPSNPAAYGMETCIATLTGLVRQLVEGRGQAECVVAAVSGAREAAQRDRIAASLSGELGAARVGVTDDLRPILYANAGSGAATVVIAGTGSSVLTQSDAGLWVRVGGRGGLMGDEGGAYRIAVGALRAAARELDGLGPPTSLTPAMPEFAGVTSVDELPAWAESATKEHIAGLAKAVLEACECGDAVAVGCVGEQVELLASQTLVSRMRASVPPEAPILLHGGLFKSSPYYRARFVEALEARRASASISLVRLDGHRAVIELAFATLPSAGVSWTRSAPGRGPLLPPTERANGSHLDEWPAEDIVRAMNREDARVAGAVAHAANAIAAAIGTAAACLRAGGRIVYMGAGTSGRLGVLDASECPPTFGVAPDRVVGLMAGGEAALIKGVEGAEDDTAAAAADLTGLVPALSEKDFVLGIAASGTTPYVLTGLEFAGGCGARTALLCCNPAIRQSADLIITVDTGPEVLPGSTRLKAGTATKMVLNMISTGAMALSGRVFEGYMVGMKPVNEKLRRRAVRIVSALTALGDHEAEKLLNAAGGRISVAVLMHRLNLDVAKAERRWRDAGEDLRAALEQDNWGRTGRG